MDPLLNGIFEYEQLPPQIRPERLELPQGLLTSRLPQVMRGKFYIEGPREQWMHGFLHGADARLFLEPVEFRGILNEIQVQYDCTGLPPGAMVEGEILVSTDHGEYRLPYTVQVPAVEKSEEMPFAGPEDFSELASRDFQGAYLWFLKPAFRRMLEETPQLASLYEGLLAAGTGYATMEKFLVCAGLKEPVVFSLEEEHFDVGELSESVQEILHLHRTGWGFATVWVEADASFVRLQRGSYDTDEFVAGDLEIPVILDQNLLHGGKNLARLTVRAGEQEFALPILAQKKEKRGQEHVRKIMRKKLLELYVDFRFKRIDAPTWAEHSAGVLSSYKRSGGEDPFANLFLIQAYLAGDFRNKASLLLEQMEARRQLLTAPEHYGFYLYLTTFFYREASYTDRVEEELRQMAHRYPDNWVLLWILLYLQEDYLTNPGRRYEAVSEQFRRGCRSRILYVEAWQCVRENPFLLRRVDEFVLALVRFAKKEGVLTAEVLHQLAALVPHQSQFSPQLFQILSDGYQTYPSVDLLKAICQLLLLSNHQKSADFIWFERGVQAQLRLNGLYEAYIRTMDPAAVPEFRALPQIIRLYFPYDTGMDYRKRAKLYGSIWNNRESDPMNWQNHRAAMEHFTLEQLELGHCCDELVTLYRALLREPMLTRALAVKLIALLFTCEVRTDGLPWQIAQVVVHGVHCENEVSVSVREGCAYVPVYDAGSTVFGITPTGERVALSEVRRMFDADEADDRLLAWCAKKAPQAPGLLLVLTTRSLAEGILNAQLLPYFRAGAEEKTFTKAYRTLLKNRVLSYYIGEPAEESLEAFLDEISLLDYLPVDKAALVTLLVREGRMEEAFRLIDTNGLEGVPLLELVKIAGAMVLEMEFEANHMLATICETCFFSGTYDDKILRYLLLYYEGDVAGMRSIWCAAAEFDLETREFEEKLLMLLLFTRSATGGTEVIFDSYARNQGKKKLCKAYVNLKSYEYFVKGQPVAEPVFVYIEKEYAALRDNNDLSEQEQICRLALLQYYSMLAELSGERREIAAELLDEFQALGLRFAFFRRFDEELVRPCLLEGHVFAEYVGNPKSRVTISYRYKRGEKFQKEVVARNFEGVFVREFTLFAGEMLECSFEEVFPEPRPDGTRKLVTDYRVLRTDPQKDAASELYTRFLAIATNQADALEDYLTLEYLAEEIFTLV